MKAKSLRRLLTRAAGITVMVVLAVSLVAPPVHGATPEQIESAIEDGLAWFATQQNADGSWGTYAYVSHTGLALLKFETHATFKGMSPLNPAYTYKQVVEDGLNYIFSQLESVPISVQPAGDPDTNGNGIGVRAMAWDSYHYTYEAACALMAIAASNEPSMVVGVGSQAGRTYADVAQDMVDYFAWGQNEGGLARGGWGYYENESTSWSDNSNSGYVTMALGFAEAPAPYGMGLTIPGFVLTEMDIFITNIQDPVDGDPDDGGSWYVPGYWAWVNTLKTGNLLQQMSMVGDTLATQRVQDAIDYIERHWNDPNQDPGWGKTGNVNYQATFTVMKGFQSLGVELIDTGAGPFSWYDEMADRIVSTQNPDGSWPSDAWGGSILTTAWAMLTLQKAAPPALMLEPLFDTNPAGTSHTVTLTYKIAGVPQSGVPVEIEVVSGPNAGKMASGFTDAGGRFSLTYIGAGDVGTDAIVGRVLATPGGQVILSSRVSKTWTPADSVPAAGGGAYPMWTALLAGLMAGASLLALRRRRRGRESA